MTNTLRRSILAVGLLALGTVAIVGPAAAATIISGSGTSNVIVNADGSPFLGVVNGPTEVVIAPDYSFSYIASGPDDNVVPFDLATKTAQTPIPVGDNPQDIVISPDGSRLYTANSSTNTVTEIDTATHTVVATHPVTTFPQAVALSPDGASLWVASGAGPYTVVEFSLPSFTVTLGPIAVGQAPNALDVSPDGAELYVTSGAIATVTAVDTTTGTLTPILLPDAPADAFPFSVAVSPDSGTAWVGDSTNGVVYPVDTATHVLGAPISTSAFGLPYDVAVSPNGDWLYISTNSGNVLVVSTADTTQMSSLVAAGSMYGLAVSDDGTRIQATSYEGDGLFIYNVAQLTVSTLDPIQQGAVAKISVQMDDGLAVPGDYTSGDVQVLVRNAANVAVFVSPVLHLDADGFLSVDVPTAALPVGTYSVEAIWIDADVAMVANAPGLDVTAVLAATGADVLPLALGGVLLLVAGLVIAASRRRSATP